jgi:MoaA/NifB/PqqE/SkfB family radical SAM enzyme
MTSEAYPIPDQAPQLSDGLLNCKLESVRSFVGFLRGQEIPTHPLNVFLEVSNACDLKCAMCGPFSALSDYRHASIKKETRGFMAADVLASGGLDEIFKHAFEVHCFGYGEPTLNPEFKRFVGLANQYAVTVDFFTNGMHLDEALIAYMVDNNVCQITISFSGSTKEEYENIYIGGKFETVLENIRKLADYKKLRMKSYPRIVINSLGYKHHVEKLELFMEIMGRAGVNQVQLGPLHKSFAILESHAAVMRPWVEGEIIARARSVGEQYGTALYSGAFEAAAVANEEEYQGVIDTQFQLLSEAGIAGHVEAQNLVSVGRSRKQFSPSLVGVDPDVFGENHLRKGLLTTDVNDLLRQYDFRPAASLGAAAGLSCYEPFKTFYITRNQNVKPCCNAVVVPPSAPLGSVRENSAMEVWSGSPYRLLRQGMLKSEYPNMCHGCVRQKTAYLDHFFEEIIGRYATWFQRSYGQVFPVDLSLIRGMRAAEFWTGPGRPLSDPALSLSPSPVAGVVEMA